LKLKPNSNIQKSGFVQLGVSTYGGGIWHTWFDRDLTMAGRVIVRVDDNCYQSRLVFINRPILRIPSLAIHLDRTVNEDFKFNHEDNFIPILGTVVKSELGENDDSKPNSSLLLNLLAKELNVDVENIVNFDLDICDFQESQIGGINNEFIFSPRIDNLVSSYCALKSLIETCETIEDETNTRLIVLYDNEEVGSSSYHGACSTILKDAIERITESFFTEDDREHSSLIASALRQSFLISADMAHALHPNYSSKHEEKHRPKIHGGVVIKVNANLRYATTSESSFFIEELGRINNVPIQKFVVRNDSPCGSTIGPIVSSQLGIRTIDIGAPQLAMHSIREMCGVEDLGHYVNIMKAFFNQFTKLDQTIIIDVTIPEDT